MFEQISEQPVYRRRGFSKKGWAKYLSFYLFVSIVSIFWFRHLSERDARIAERERVVIGAINAIHKGKSDSADYTFQFEGTNYLGNDDCDYLNLTAGGIAKVFLDPQNPRTNGLRSFAFESKTKHGFSNLMIYLAGALAIISATLWLRVLNSEETVNFGEKT